MIFLIFYNVQHFAFFASTLCFHLQDDSWVRRIPKYWLCRNVWGLLVSRLSPLPQLWSATFLQIFLHTWHMFLQPSASTCTNSFTVKLRQYFSLKRRNEPGALYGIKSRNTDIFRMTTRAMFRKLYHNMDMSLKWFWPCIVVVMWK